MSKRKRQEEEQLDDLKLLKKPLKFSIDSIMSTNQQQLHLQQQQQQPPQADNNNQTPKRYSIDNVECTLDNQDIWKAFNSLNTEMIITKTGRRMFPVMKVQFHNLSPSARYAVSMDIVPVDTKRYRYAYHKSCWQVAGKADPSAEPRLYAHPDSPLNGDLLARQVISFEKVKLTNNEADKSGHIILNSMHKYQPRVHLIELKQTLVSSSTSSSGSNASGGGGGKLNYHQNNHHHQYNNNNNNNHHHHKQQAQPQLDIEGYKTFVFPETVFTAVTAYQNQLITKMKIDKNPFAKGFRDSSRLSDLDRSDPFDYMGPLGSVGGRPPAGSLEAAAAAAAAAAAGSNMDAYQLLASSPWYSAAAMAAAAASTGGTGGGGGAGSPANPFGSISQAAACSTAQAAQQLQVHMWMAAFNACLGGAAASGALGGPGGLPQSPMGAQQPPPPTQLAGQPLGQLPPAPPPTTTSTTPNGTSPLNPFAAAAAAMLQMPPSGGGPGGAICSPQLTVDGDEDDGGPDQRHPDDRDQDEQDDDPTDEDNDDDDASENEHNHRHNQISNNHHHHHQHHHRHQNLLNNYHNQHLNLTHINHLNLNHHHLQHHHLNELKQHTGGNNDSRGGSSADSSGTSA